MIKRSKPHKVWLGCDKGSQYKNNLGLTEESSLEKQASEYAVALWNFPQNKNE
jgi:hypothetical protein